MGHVDVGNENSTPIGRRQSPFLDRLRSTADSDPATVPGLVFGREQRR